MFLHYWGRGKAQELAKSVQAAINLATASIDNDSPRQRKDPSHSGLVSHFGAR
jgi:hypothetical protein